MNTRCLEEGIQKLKPNLKAFEKPDDPRLNWLETEFLGYLDEWKSCANKWKDFTPAQKMMQLSAESLEGLRITVKAFVEMERFLLKLPGVKYLLSERFCQDSLEEFFSQQRAQGRRNDNPTASEFKKTTVSIRIQSSTATDPLYGNCRGRKRAKDKIIIDNTPLPKRKRSK